MIESGYALHSASVAFLRAVLGPVRSARGHDPDRHPAVRVREHGGEPALHVQLVAAVLARELHQHSHRRVAGRADALRPARGFLRSRLCSPGTGQPPRHGHCRQSRRCSGSFFFFRFT